MYTISPFITFKQYNSCPVFVFLHKWENAGKHKTKWENPLFAFGALVAWSWLLLQLVA